MSDDNAEGFAPLLFRFFNEIGIIEQLASARFESTLPDGLKLSQFAVLNHLVRLGGSWSPLRLAKTFQVTKGAMTNTLQKLESRKLIHIEPDPEDGRAKLVTLTDAGREMRESCVQNIAPLLGEIHKELGIELFEKTLPSLEKVRIYLDNNR